MIELFGTRIVKFTLTNPNTGIPEKTIRNMKKLMMIAAVTIFTAAAVNAQDQERKTPAERAKIQTEQMTKALDLTPEQVEKVSLLNAQYAEKAEMMRKERQAQRQAMKEENKGAGRELHDARMNDLKGILTPEQFTKMEAIKEEKKEEHMEKRKEMRGSDAGDKKEIKK
ncbi:MAG: hypothetical protein WAR83_04705 [Flavobacteriales bacterium]